MKPTIFSKVLIGSFLLVTLLATVAFAVSGTIDPTNAGKNKAAFLDSSVVADTAINFGKFTTQAAYNITVSDTELRGYAWGASVGYIVMNCADTTSGCSSTNGNFKVANNAGTLSGYAWGENTGWINFGPFTEPTISTVKIGTNGDFGGTLGSAGYAWSQNYGWIKFDCTSNATCTNTDWRVASAPSGGGGGGGAGGTPGGSTGGTGTQPTTGPGSPQSGIPAQPITVPPSYVGLVASSVVCDTGAAMPKWGIPGRFQAINSTTAINYVNASNGHCHFDAGQSYQWSYPDDTHPTVFGPTDATGTTQAITPITTGNPVPVREVIRPGFVPFSLDTYGDNDHLPSAEMYCETDAINRDNLDFIRTQQSQRTYYCVSFNTPLANNPTPTIPGTTPSHPTTPTTPTNPSTTHPGDDGRDGEPQFPEQPPVGTIPHEEPTTTPVTPNSQPSDTPRSSSDESNGSGLGGAFVEAVNNITNSLRTLAHNLASTPVAAAVLQSARTPAGRAFTTAISAIGVATTAIGSAALIVLANPFTLAEFALLPFRLWSLLLVAFGLKKKNRPWGTVYDSVTKQPIDPAYVMLTDMEGNEVATSITDIDGRYGFSVPPGTYKIIANKTNYEYPSKKLSGKEADELYTGLYFGETLVVREEGEIIAKNIPMDQLNFDWNEFAKNEQKRLSYYKRSDVVIARLSNLFFWFGFVVAAIALLAAHTGYNIAVFCVYIGMFAIRHYSPAFKAKGSITEALSDEPMSFAIVHVISAATGQEITHKVADRLGNYYCLVPNGTYNIVVDRKNPDATYTKIPVAMPVQVTEGYLKADFKV